MYFQGKIVFFIFFSSKNNYLCCQRNLREETKNYLRVYTVQYAVQKQNTNANNINDKIPKYKEFQWKNVIEQDWLS